LWDFAVFYANERELFPSYSLSWNTPPGISFCKDDAVPIGSSQHQKLIVVDDCVAFSGGLDVTIRRWDTPSHDADHPLRRDVYGKTYRPFELYTAAMIVYFLLCYPVARLVDRVYRRLQHLGSS